MQSRGSEWEYRSPNGSDIATALSRRDISFNLERLLVCGGVKVEDTGYLVLDGLSAPRLLQLEPILDEILVPALKGRRARKSTILNAPKLFEP